MPPRSREARLGSDHLHRRLCLLLQVCNLFRRVRTFLLPLCLFPEKKKNHFKWLISFFILFFPHLHFRIGCRARWMNWVFVLPYYHCFLMLCNSRVNSVNLAHLISSTLPLDLSTCQDPQQPQRNSHRTSSNAMVPWKWSATTFSSLVPS
jgi:hypothetical protein